MKNYFTFAVRKSQRYFYMYKAVLVIVFSVFLASCNSYQKALKSEDVEFRNKVFVEKYEKKKYGKAIRLFELYGSTLRGNKNSEALFYKYADALYQDNQYIQAAYQFDSYASNYPTNEKAEMAAFLGAECYTKLTYLHSLDQTDNLKAIEKIQNFIDRHPNSKLIPQSNELMNKLTYRVELKDYEIAKLYNSISDHKAAIIALDNFIIDYPGSSLKEKALYYKLDSAYNLAINSVPDKKKERLNDAKSFYNQLIKYKNNTEFLGKATAMLNSIDNELKQYN